MTSGKVPTGKITGKIVSKIYKVTCGKCRGSKVKSARTQLEAKQYFEEIGHKFTSRFGWVCPECQRSPK